ncbi:MAG: hypothetical protein J7L76_02505 [Spirochaetaceae bacterium]|nr:hypothetical protein [Spirochaetaceae bacterium]
MTVDSLTSILEEEFSLAFNVKDEKALKRSLTILTGNMVSLGFIVITVLITVYQFLT